MHRLIVISLALAALVFAWACMTAISRTDPWYRNADMNIPHMADSLAINSGLAPQGIDQPGVPLKYALALDFRLRHELGLLPVWNLKEFGASADPVREMPPLIRIERLHSRVLVILFILTGAGLTYAITRRIEAAGLTVILLCGSSGLLFHGLLTRPELLCVWLGNGLALLCAWRATTGYPGMKHHLWLMLAGLFCGLAAAEKQPGWGYLVICHGWCWLAALTRPETAGGSDPTAGNRLVSWGGLGPAVAAGAMLGLLSALASRHDVIGSVTLVRLRLAAVLVGTLPVLTLWPGRSRPGLFLLGRARELALLGGGALAALPIGYLLLRMVLPEAGAMDYTARVLHGVIDPGPVSNAYPVGLAGAGRLFLLIPPGNLLLFFSAAAVAGGVCLLRPVPGRLKAMIALLLATAMGLTWLLRTQPLLAHHELFFQVPLLLVWSLSLAGLEAYWRRREPAGGLPWAVPLLVTAALVVTLTVYFRLQPKYSVYQRDAWLPVNGLTLTVLFDHDAHPRAYLQIMQEHYGDRGKFAVQLEHYLADPANRY